MSQRAERIYSPNLAESQISHLFIDVKTAETTEWGSSYSISFYSAEQHQSSDCFLWWGRAYWLQILKAFWPSDGYFSHRIKIALLRDLETMMFQGYANMTLHLGISRNSSLFITCSESSSYSCVQEMPFLPLTLLEQKIILLVRERELKSMDWTLKLNCKI